MAKYGLVRLSSYSDLVAEFDLERNHPHIPEDYTHRTNKRVWWLCSAHGHSWETSVSTRTQGSGCPFCGRKRLLSGFNDLETLNPTLASEWDYCKNLGVSPSEVTVSADKNFWWICPTCAHSYKALVSNRNKGSGCMKCSVANKYGRLPVPMGQDLLTKRPDVALEWDSLRNGEDRPDLISATSNEKVWWICSEGHSYFSPVGGRTGNKAHGCFACSVVRRRGSSKSVTLGETDLLSQNPEVSKEWDYSKNLDKTPDQISAYSQKKVWWVCPKGHSYNRSIKVRHVQGPPCSICSGKVVLAGFNDLGTVEPDLASEWDPIKNLPTTPKEVNSVSMRKFWWLCPEHSHSYSATINSRTREGFRTGCPICSGRQVLFGFNDLETLDPKLSAEWDYLANRTLTPREVTSKSERKVWWMCQDKHTYFSGIKNRSYGSGCPKCFESNNYSKVEVDLCNFMGAQRDVHFPVMWKSGHRMRVDGLLRESIVVEYDGSYWHDDVSFPGKREKDIEKTTTLISHGYTVVRVRENELPFLPPQEGLIQVRHLYAKNDIDGTAKEIQRLLAKSGRLTEPT